MPNSTYHDFDNPKTWREMTLLFSNQIKIHMLAAWTVYGLRWFPLHTSIGSLPSAAWWCTAHARHFVPNARCSQRKVTDVTAYIRLPSPATLDSCSVNHQPAHAFPGSTYLNTRIHRLYDTILYVFVSTVFSFWWPAGWPIDVCDMLLPWLVT